MNIFDLFKEAPKKQFKFKASCWLYTGDRAIEYEFSKFLYKQQHMHDMDIAREIEKQILLYVGKEGVIFTKHISGIKIISKSFETKLGDR